MCSASLSFSFDTSTVSELLGTNTANGSHNTNGGTTYIDTVKGTAEAGATVTLTEGTLTLGTTAADTSGNWSFTPISLAQGTNTIVATETNAAHYVSTASLTFVYDTSGHTELLGTNTTEGGA